MLNIHTYIHTYISTLTKTTKGSHKTAYIFLIKVSMKENIVMIRVT
jgi:hypothetical protein